MVRKRKLLARMRNNPRNVRFSDLVLLVEAAGFEFKRQVGSHRQYWHPTAHEALNLQPDANPKAKVSQVREFLETVDAYGLDVGEGEV
jgi:predicted RNA binding protein YcfA (HicA-like mRNA interferase family)